MSVPPTRTSPATIATTTAMGTPFCSRRTGAVGWATSSTYGAGRGSTGAWAIAVCASFERMGWGGGPGGPPGDVGAIPGMATPSIVPNGLEGSAGDLRGRGARGGRGDPRNGDAEHRRTGARPLCGDRAAVCARSARGGRGDPRDGDAEHRARARRGDLGCGRRAVRGGSGVEMGALAVALALEYATPSIVLEAATRPASGACSARSTEDGGGGARASSCAAARARGDGLRRDGCADHRSLLGCNRRPRSRRRSCRHRDGRDRDLRLGEPHRWCRRVRRSARLDGRARGDRRSRGLDGGEVQRRRRASWGRRCSVLRRGRPTLTAEARPFRKQSSTLRAGEGHG